MGNQTSFNFSADSENINLIDMNLTKLPFNPPLENKAKYLYLSGNKITTLPENMKEIIFVDLSNNQMGPSIPNLIAKALTSYMKLKTIYLSDNRLEIYNDIFESFCLESFDLVQNRFRELPEDFFTRFPILKTLYFDCNFLTVFPKQVSESIITLSMSLNCIESIDTTITHFPQLASLDLSKNQLKVIPNDFSKSFPNLHDLNLSYNFISNIPDNDDDNIVFPKTLKELNLSNNAIEKVSNSITSLTNLTTLNISNNQITSIPVMPELIQKLNAHDNQIHSIEKQSFNLIKEMNLANNELTEFPTEIKMSQNNSIILDHNHISAIRFKTIPVKKIFPKTIMVVDLSFNDIESIPGEIFESMTNLQSFCAIKNKLTVIPTEISSCHKLNHLDVSFNPLKKLPKLPRSLTRLLASNCELNSFDDAFCDPQPTPETGNSTEIPKVDNSIHLKHADFSGNKFESFPIVPSIQILNLSQNYLKKLPALTNQIKTLDVSMNELESKLDSMPDVISSKSIVELNLSHNKLTEVPNFQNVPILQYLELSGNPIQGKLNIMDQLFLERVGIAQTGITISGINETIHEVITSRNDTKVFTSPKNEPRTKSPILRKPIYVNQKVSPDGKYRSGFSEILGLRNSMEDSIIVRDDLNLYAVCDGHAGPDTAKFTAIQMPELIEKSIKGKSFSYEKSKQFVLNAFQQTEKNLQKLGLPDGSTLCLCLICSDANKRKIVSAHLGDARAMIVQVDGKPRDLTKDHKPTMRSEFERIHNVFGRVSKENRVDGLLAVARSIGDFKVFGLGREPELNEFEIDDVNDRFLVIGCDGVFDVLSNEDVAIVASKCSSPTEAAFSIRNAAFGCSSTDNISVIVVDLFSK